MLNFMTRSLAYAFDSFTFHSWSLIIDSSGHIVRSKLTYLSFINPLASKLGKNGALPKMKSREISGFPELVYLTL